LLSDNRNLTSEQVSIRSRRWTSRSTSDQPHTTIHVVERIPASLSDSARTSAHRESSTTAFDQSNTSINDLDRGSVMAPESVRTSVFEIPIPTNRSRTVDLTGQTCGRLRAYFFSSRSKYCAIAFRTCHAVVLSVLSERIRSSRITLNGIRKAMVSESISFGGIFE
jgi:hypothetical protein